MPNNFWIPSDPDDYLHSLHSNQEYGTAFPDWQIDYAGWRYFYAPGYRKLARRLLGPMSAADFCRRAQPFVPIARALIPDDLKLAVSQVQPDDWTKLPDDQIRRVWDNKNCVFAKVVLALATLQTLAATKGGQLGRITFVDDQIKQSDRLVEALRGLEFKGPTVFDQVKLHMATYAFSNHDRAFWANEIAKADRVADDFAKHTGQRQAKFLESFAEGRLATIQSLVSIRQWLDENQKDHRPGAIRYLVKDDQRIKAARKEAVKPQKNPT